MNTGTDYPPDGNNAVSAATPPRGVGVYAQAYGNPYGYARVPINSTGDRQLPSKYGGVTPPKYTRTYFPMER